MNQPHPSSIHSFLPLLTGVAVFTITLCASALHPASTRAVAYPLSFSGSPPALTPITSVDIDGSDVTDIPDLLELVNHFNRPTYHPYMICHRIGFIKIFD